MSRDLRPRIKVTADLSTTVDETVAALMSYNDPPQIYQYHNKLVRIVDGCIQYLNSHMLRNYAAAAAIFYKETTHGDKEIIPPMNVMSSILALPGYDVPRLFVRRAYYGWNECRKNCEVCAFFKGQDEYDKTVICANEHAGIRWEDDS